MSYGPESRRIVPRAEGISSVFKNPRATGTQKAPARGDPGPRGVNQGFVAEKRFECPFMGCPALQVAFRWLPRGRLPRLSRLSPGHEVTLKNRNVLGAHPPSDPRLGHGLQRLLAKRLACDVSRPRVSEPAHPSVRAAHYPRTVAPWNGVAWPESLRPVAAGIPP